ncbi:MAG: carboxymuconolactone decarboxylase family protein [Candidatus Acidiferrum sp.]
MHSMLDWNEYYQDLGARIGDLAKLSPDTLRGYQTLSAANTKTSKLGEKTRQLISLAVAVTTRCDGCIVFHSEAALKAGATREEIAESLGVAVAMNAGAALVFSSRVLDAVDARSAQAQGA